MTDDSRDLDARFERLSAATESVGPRPDFLDRVMQAVQSEAEIAVASSGPEDWLKGVLAASRFALGAAALMAVVAIAFALQSQPTYDEEMLLTYDTVQVGW
jgi:anti-sigma-K factor RskA